MLWEHKIPTAIKAHRIFAELAKTTSFKKGVTKIKKKKKRNSGFTDKTSR